MTMETILGDLLLRKNSSEFMVQRLHAQGQIAEVTKLRDFGGIYRITPLLFNAAT
jgi:hypothetical protein